MRKNMFAESTAHPAATFRVSAKRELPAHMANSHNVQPRATANHGVVPAYANAPPPEQAISGAQRMQFFHAPPAGAAAAGPTATVVLDAAVAAGAGMQAQAAGAAQASNSARDRGAASRTGRRVAADGRSASVGIQTMYRDSEAQTDAYTPDFVLPSADAAPDVLLLANLEAGGAAGHALPGGLPEVEYLEELRARRELEASLPPLTDEASFEVRRSLMEQLESRAWEWHESEAKSNSDRRVDAIMDAVRSREAAREFRSQQRLEEMRARAEAARDVELAKLQRKRISTLRQLGKSRAATEAHVDALTGSNTMGTDAARKRGKRSQRDIIAEYADYGSKVYAPQAREGQAARTTTVREAPGALGGGAAAAGGAALDSVATVMTLEATMPGSTLRRRVTAPPADAKPTSNAERADAAVARDLARVHGMLRTAKAGIVADGESKSAEPGRAGTKRVGGSLNLPLPPSTLDAEPVPAWRKPRPVLQRPPSPRWADEDESEAEAQVDAAAILVQKLLRGRAVQNSMFEGKARRMDLIREMRQDLLMEDERAAVEAAEAAAQREEEARLAAQAVTSTAVGEVASAALQFLAAEHKRRIEMSKIAAMAGQANAVRASRESAEAGRRAAEVQIREHAERVYQAMASTFRVDAQSVVESAVQAALLAVSGVAPSGRAGSPSSTASAVPAAGTPSSPEQVSRELVGSILLPRAQAQLEAAAEPGHTTPVQQAAAAVLASITAAASATVAPASSPSSSQASKK